MSLRDLHAAAQQAQQQAEQAAAALHTAVAKAMNAGRTAVQIADECGVSRSRVYQWRAKAK